MCAEFWCPLAALLFEMRRGPGPVRKIILVRHGYLSERAHGLWGAELAALLRVVFRQLPVRAHLLELLGSQRKPKAICATCKPRHHEADDRLRRKVEVAADCRLAPRGRFGVVVVLVLAQDKPDGAAKRDLRSDSHPCTARRTSRPAARSTPRGTTNRT